MQVTRAKLTAKSGYKKFSDGLTLIWTLGNPAKVSWGGSRDDRQLDLQHPDAQQYRNAIAVPPGITVHVNIGWRCSPEQGDTLCELKPQLQPMTLEQLIQAAECKFRRDRLLPFCGLFVDRNVTPWSAHAVLYATFTDTGEEFDKETTWYADSY